MRLGFFTSCFYESELDQIAEWAQVGGFRALEVAVWPHADVRHYNPAHIDVEHLDERGADQLRTVLNERGIMISSLAYYGNNLHADPDTRRLTNRHVKRVIDAAVLLGVSNIGTFIGRDMTKSVLENVHQAEQVFPELVDYAGERSIDVVIENCVMEGWHPDGYPANLAYSPELWEWMFEELGVYLNFDPSHLVWMGIDPVAALRPYVDRVKHVQAKDIQISPQDRTRFGWPGRIFGKKDGWDTGWWRYRVPGRGDVDWRGVIDTLAEGGYDGTISVEHEDPVWSGSIERVRAGLEIARRTLEPLIVDPTPVDA